MVLGHTKEELEQRKSEIISRLEEAREWNTVRTLGPLAVYAPGRFTVGMLRGVTNWIKPNDASIGSALAASGKSIVGAAAIIAAIFPSVLLDAGDAVVGNIRMAVGPVPPGADLPDAGVRAFQEELETIEDELAHLVEGTATTPSWDEPVSLVEEIAPWEPLPVSEAAGVEQVIAPEEEGATAPWEPLSVSETARMEQVITPEEEGATAPWDSLPVSEASEAEREITPEEEEATAPWEPLPVSEASGRGHVTLQSIQTNLTEIDQGPSPLDETAPWKPLPVSETLSENEDVSEESDVDALGLGEEQSVISEPMLREQDEPASVSDQSVAEDEPEERPAPEIASDAEMYGEQSEPSDEPAAYGPQSE